MSRQNVVHGNFNPKATVLPYPHKITREIYYSMDDNNFSDAYGEVIYNLWDYFWPHQIELFKECGGPSKAMLTKQWKAVIIVSI